MSSGVTSLARADVEPAGKPVRPEAPDNQRLMLEILNDPSSWTTEIADLTTQVFDAMSTSWVGERGGYRPAPLLDALERGAVPDGGRCLEIGSGTGVLTPYLAGRWLELVCVDLSEGMMRHNPHASQVRADASSLPFPSHSFDAVVIGDGPLFAHELTRVMADAGTLIWSNALGTGAPYYLPTPAILDALRDVAPASAWTAIESEVLWGSWAVVRRT